MKFNKIGDKLIIGSYNKKAYLLDGNTLEKIAEFETSGKI